MSDWKEILNQNDIDELMDVYGGFHDACIVSLEYKSGLYVYSERIMHFDEPEKCEVLITFHSQWNEKPLELYFSGVRKMFVQGRMDNYENEIYDASIKFYDGLLPHKYSMPERVIVWADSEDFDAETDATSSKDEPCDTYVIANALKWRLVD
ncbi:MAG: hypothetical protein K2K39_03900 [Clostridia bacterium]|nr:hypothetical protein [Clostridia bacterium]